MEDTESGQDENENEKDGTKDDNTMKENTKEKNTVDHDTNNRNTMKAKESGNRAPYTIGPPKNHFNGEVKCEWCGCRTIGDLDLGCCQQC